MDLKSERMGKLVKIDGKEAFIPRSLTEIEIDMGPDLQMLLSKADLSVGRLDALSEFLPNPDLFVMIYIKKEAVWSSQIEGTQASLMDVLEFEAEVLKPGAPRDVKEVVNYVKAMNRGIDHIRKGYPIDLRMIRDLHSILMKDTRGGNMGPGEFRSIQNRIGPHGYDIDEALYVPPPPDIMIGSLKDLEDFMRNGVKLPPLIKAAMIHYQFESIHPFINGNGRMGRLLMVLSLINDGHPRSPLLYISHYLRQMRSAYYDKLQDVRIKGDLEGWLKFILVGISQVAEEASNRARDILKLSEDTKSRILRDLGRNGPRGAMLINGLLRRPVVGVNEIAHVTDLSYQNANKLASKLESMRILKEITGKKRNRIFEFSEYLDLLNDCY